MSFGGKVLLLGLLCVAAQDMTEDDDVESSVDLFSSAAELQKLFSKERQLRSKLEDYIGQLDAQSKTLNAFLQRHYKDKDNGEDYVGNPIDTFAMLKRTGLYWPGVKKVVGNESLTKAVEDITQLLESLPKSSDVEGAANGIFLLHETYELNLTRFSMGALEVPGGKDVLFGGAKLAAFDLEQLGKLAYNRGFYDRATEWMEAALWKANKEYQEAEGQSSTAEIKRIDGMLKVMQKKHDQVLDTKGAVGEDWRTFAIPFDEKLRKKKRFRKIKDKRHRSEQPKLFEPMTSEQHWESFNALCRGERLRPVEMDRNLTCNYIHFGDPYLRLGPFKVEQFNLEPFLSVFHDFMYDSEITAYKEYATGKLHRSRHLSKKGEPNEASLKRTSSQAWLGESETSETGELVVKHPEAFKFSQRITLATRMYTFLNLGGEPFQVANYGIGGVYNHHTDSRGEAAVLMPGSDELISTIGDRIATSMTYLSDVEAGGATVFPNTGVTLWPKKGNMAFWYNNDFNGNLDALTFHGGCPVLAGSKWITNRWIRSFAQWKKFPCTTEAPNVLRRLKPLNNSFCDMTKACDDVTVKI